MKQEIPSQWYNVDIVVEILINETPRGQRYAPEIGNLCIGFTKLTIDKLRDEIDDMRATWPFLFSKATSTKDLLKIVKKKYSAYQEIMSLREVK